MLVLCDEVRSRDAVDMSGYVKTVHIRHLAGDEKAVAVGGKGHLGAPLKPVVISVSPGDWDMDGYY